MNPTPKINLSAIAKKKQADKTVLEEKNDEVKTDLDNWADTISDSVVEVKEEKVEKVEEKVSMIPKISLFAIKTSKSPEEIRELNEDNAESKHKELKEELIETLVEDEQNNDLLKSDALDNTSTDKSESSEIEQNEEKVDEEVKTDENKEKIDESKVDLESLAEIEKKINEKVEEEVKQKIKKDTDESDKEIVDENAEVFWNYKSEFIKKEDVIIQKVETEHKKFRERLREPKTRILLVLWMILITAWVIAWLFYFDPENHSFEKYKTVLTNNYNDFNKNYIEKDWVLDVVTIDSYKFDTYTQKKLLWGDTYKYKEVVYKTKDEMLQVINTEATVLKQEAEKIRLEQERLAAEQARAEQARLEAERIAKEQDSKRIEQFNKTKAAVKDILHEKYKELFWIK